MIRTSFTWQATIAAMVMAMIAAWGTSPLHAKDDDGNWMELGEAEISDKDSDNRVQIQSEERAVKSIKLRVGQKAVKINSIVVAFEEGENQTISIGQTLEPGTMTKEYDLQGKKRRISSIVINASIAKKAEGKAKLIVYGQKG